MKNNTRTKRTIFFVFLFLTLAVLFFFAVRRQINYPAPATRVFERGDKVKIYGTENSYITVVDSKIVSKEDYLAFSGDEDYYPDSDLKAVVVHFVINNEGKNPENIEYNRFPISYLASKNMAGPYKLFKEIKYDENTKEWKAERGVKFETLPGEETEGYMVVTFLEINDPADVWKNFDNNPIYLTVSYYPVHQKIRLN
ncbi:hypothetical protein [Lagierella sp.]|uniref:hypothetical protein n=1 Tax=Lagierella sp. TaxID=2849657 RepID=UPI00261CEE17|nr:hypothetical protein [Lagierella sp.]